MLWSYFRGLSAEETAWQYSGFNNNPRNILNILTNVSWPIFGDFDIHPHPGLFTFQGLIMHIYIQGTIVTIVSIASMFSRPLYAIVCCDIHDLPWVISIIRIHFEASGILSIFLQCIIVTWLVPDIGAVQPFYNRAVFLHPANPNTPPVISTLISFVIDIAVGVLSPLIIDLSNEVLAAALGKVTSKALPPREVIGLKWSCTYNWLPCVTMQTVPCHNWASTIHCPQTRPE